MRDQTMTNRANNYSGIDAGKLIVAILVIAAHTQPLYGCTNPYLVALLHSLTQSTSLFFFLCTGFFLRKKVGNAPSADWSTEVWRSLIKSIKLYVIWSAIYAPLAIVFFYKSGYSVGKAIASYLRGFFLMGQNYNSWMLWYLLSCIYALLFLYFLLKRNVRLGRITFLGGAVYLTGLLVAEFAMYGVSLPAPISAVSYLISRIIENGRIFSGFFFLPMGMLLAEKKPFPGIGSALLLCGIGGDILLGGVPGSLSRGLIAIGMFLMASGLRLKSRPLYPMLRRMSSILYFIHMYVWTFYYTLVYGQVTYGADSFLVTTLVCLLLAYLFITVQSRRKSRQ